jgi:acetyl-CoA carboxylase biotin carboxyl carrier protein
MVDQLSFTEVGDILGLIGRLDCDTFELEYGELRINVSRDGAQSPPPAAATPGSVTVTTPPDDQPPEATRAEAGSPTGAPSATAVAVTAPMTGTFYRAPAPDAPPCVTEGEQVEQGQTVGLVEVMKLYTELRADAAGVVLRVDAAEGSLVEYGQPLLWIEPR